MAWDINERGSIDVTPVLTWETGIIQEIGCGLRLVLAHPPGEPQTTTTVQAALTVEQAEQLIEHLQQMVDRILNAQSLVAPH